MATSHTFAGGRARDFGLKDMASRKITPVPYTKLVKVFERDGFVIRRRKGDHIIMVVRRESAVLW